MRARAVAERIVGIALRRAVRATGGQALQGVIGEVAGLGQLDDRGDVADRVVGVGEAGQGQRQRALGQTVEPAGPL